LIFAFNPNGTLTDYSRSDTTTDIPDDVQPSFEKAVLAIRNRRFEDALDILNEAITTNPTVARLYFNRGDVLADMGRREDAIADYTRVMELQPENPEAYYNRAVTYQEMQNRKQAFADFSQALRLNPEHYAAYVNRGGILLHAGQLDKAIEDFTRAITINPQGFHAYLYRGRAYVKRGAYEQAVVDFNRSNDIQPQYDTLLDRAEAYAAADRTKEAIADYEEFLRVGGGQRFGNQAEIQARIRELKKKRSWF
ncbi:MAG TPA: tetratricopeptide repeat protein, partial [Verrucomicrobiae bacterium]|nr:tetratricopeptide repeat protein [Verrucomicrobiae bacterium]